MSGDDDLEREFPCWHWWRGVSGLYYVRRVKSSPPIVLRAESKDELVGKVRVYLAERAQR